tara:strand:+ start:297 stop:662 length:366 start_codon:yes stop_codon:yes gene_type:complete
MSKSQLDIVIEEKLHTLREEKYRLRTFQVVILVKISADYGIEETSQDIRSLPGVTVVTAIDSQYLESMREWSSVLRIKFHPQKDSLPGADYVKKILIPAINSSKIPGTRVVRQMTAIDAIK